jgi:hypothetical protein
MRRGRLLFLFSNVALFAGGLHHIFSRGGTWSDGH